VSRVEDCPTSQPIVDGQTTKWKVENSWGEKVGENGFFVMSDAWMDEYTYVHQLINLCAQRFDKCIRPSTQHTPWF
jgi:aminopeptidase C